MIRKGLLKGLCIFGLTLLPISFSNGAWNSVSCVEYYSNSTNVVYGNTVLTFDNGNFATQRGEENLSNVMWLTRPEFNPSSSTQGYWLSSSFGYIDGKPYLYAGYYGDSYQGYPTSVCVQSLDNFDLASFGDDMSPCNAIGIDSFLTNKNIIGGGFCYPDSTNNYAQAPFSYCFYDSDNAYCFKLTSYHNSPDLQVLTLNNSIGLSAPLTPTKLLNVDWTPSPFISSATLPDYSVGSGRQLRNYEVLIGFEYMGLSKEYCYGGFDLDNIFLPSEQFSDFSGYSFGNGATIFDLYNAYGGGLSIKPFLSTYYQSFLNAQLSNFHNKSKALLMLFQQYQSANDRGWGSFKLNDLMDYCDLYFNLKNNNRENDGDIYTGNNQNAINSYKLNTKIPEGGFTNTGVLATGSQFTGFESADDFFGRLTNLFQSNIDGVNDTFPPIIPSYIVAFMLAIILIRIISH